MRCGLMESVFVEVCSLLTGLVDRRAHAAEAGRLSSQLCHCNLTATKQRTLSQTLATERAAQARTAKACDAATTLLPIINELQAIGATTAYAIAQLLNAKGVATTRGGKWQAIQVARLMKIVAATVD